jgi:hypothetical protein
VIERTTSGCSGCGGKGNTYGARPVSVECLCVCVCVCVGVRVRYLFALVAERNGDT